MKDIPPRCTEARYAKGQIAVHCESPDGFKTRAARLAEHVKGRYSHRENAYIMSPTKAMRVMNLYGDGRDASAITGALRPLVTREIAYAAGLDAGNRSMREAGRDTWAQEDADAATQETLRLLRFGGYITLEQAKECGYD